LNNINGPYNDSMSYKIVNFWPETGQIEIECLGYNERISINLPIDNGKYPEGDDLDIYIRGFVPTWLVDRNKLINAGVSNINEIQKLVDNSTKNEAEYQKRNFNLQQVYQKRRHLLQETDWTQLSDVPLTTTEREMWKKYRQELRDITKQPLDSDMVWPIKPNNNY
jgi:hypothetical protein